MQTITTPISTAWWLLLAAWHVAALLIMAFIAVQVYLLRKGK